MKNIKYIAVLFFQCALLQFTFGQSAGDNGRPVHANPGPIDKVETSTSVAKDVPNTGSYIVDLDVAGTQDEEVQEKTKDISYPMDLEIIKEDIMATSEVAQKVEGLTTLVDDLLQITEELRLENKVIRESMNNCCSISDLRFSANANDAYLLQNAPNPFNESAEIRYFIPGDLNNVEIHIRDIKGAILNTIKVTEAGFGRLEVNSATFGNGTFVYTLSIEKEIVDSKVMIITK